jgi:hypothetical protein
MHRTPLTFPVTTACFSIDENNNIQDEEFLDFIAKQNQQFGFINIYCGASSTLSSCCFVGEQKTLTKSSNGINYLTFNELYNTRWNDNKKNLTIFHNGSWVKGKLIKLKYQNKPIYRITTSNNKTIYTTEEHLHPTLNGDKPSNKITLNDYLLFNNTQLGTFPEKNMKLTYEQGIVVGAYLGDGCLYKRTDSESYDVSYSINKEKCDILLPKFETALQQLNIKCKINLYQPQHNNYPLHIYSKELYNFIKEWVNGSYAYEKMLNLNCLIQSVEFRKGIVDGLYITDGGNSNRIYTSSPILAETIEVLLTSLGLQSIINISDRTDEKVLIRKQEFNRNYPLYCVRWYNAENKRSMKNVYIKHNNSIYFKIKDIQIIDNYQDDVYCFEINNKQEPYFTLPNGIITHNCRLRSEQTSEYFNSFGSGSSKFGSLGVCAINFPRLAIKAEKDETKFMDSLKELVEICAKINNAKRHIIKKRIDNGNEPLYTHGYMELSKQYSTVGVNGLNECVEIMGYKILNDDGVNFALRIMNIINTANKKFEKQYDAPHNCEQVPGENMSIKIAEKDKLLGYQNQYNIYSNQFIPLTTNADMLDRIRIQGILDKHFSGGAICHINVDTPIHDKNQIKELIRITAKMGVVYHAINYNLQECEDGHMTVGKNEICTICAKPIINNYTRVVGFVTSVKNWHKVRREQDYPNRQWYKDIQQ